MAKSRSPCYVIVSDFCIMYIEDSSHLPEQRKEGEVKGQRQQTGPIIFQLDIFNHSPPFSNLLCAPGFALYEPINRLPGSMAPLGSVKDHLRLAVSQILRPCQVPSPEPILS